VGEGTFGKVKLGTHQKTQEKVAVKILEKDKVQSYPDVQRVIRELQILKLLRHPHIIHLYEIIENNKRLYLIMEYADGGELFTHISKRTRIPEREAVGLFRQIISGVDKIHMMNVVHRDMKPENVLLDSWNNVKIIDFGLSNRFTQHQKLNTACGSPCYAPPEMIQGKEYVPQLCDVWSCGVILFAVICGYLPFDDRKTSGLYKKIENGDYQCPDHCSEGVRDLLSKILQPDPAKRYTIDRIRRNPWFNSSELVKRSPELKFLDYGCGLHSCRPCCNWYRPGCSDDLDETIVEQLTKMGFDIEETKDCLRRNKRNPVTASYYLLLERKTRLAYEEEKENTAFKKFDDYPDADGDGGDGRHAHTCSVDEGIDMAVDCSGDGGKGGEQQSVGGGGMLSKKKLKKKTCSTATTTSGSKPSSPSVAVVDLTIHDAEEEETESRKSRKEAIRKLERELCLSQGDAKPARQGNLKAGKGGLLDIARPLQQRAPTRSSSSSGYRMPQSARLPTCVRVNMNYPVVSNVPRLALPVRDEIADGAKGNNNEVQGDTQNIQMSARGASTAIPMSARQISQPVAMTARVDPHAGPFGGMHAFAGLDSGAKTARGPSMASMNPRVISMATPRVVLGGGERRCAQAQVQHPFLTNTVTVPFQGNTWVPETPRDGTLLTVRDTRSHLTYRSNHQQFSCTRATSSPFISASAAAMADASPCQAGANAHQGSVTNTTSVRPYSSNNNNENQHSSNYNNNNSRFGPSIVQQQNSTSNNTKPSTPGSRRNNSSKSVQSTQNGGSPLVDSFSNCGDAVGGAGGSIRTPILAASPDNPTVTRIVRTTSGGVGAGGGGAQQQQQPIGVPIIGHSHNISTYGSNYLLPSARGDGPSLNPNHGLASTQMPRISLSSQVDHSSTYGQQRQPQVMRANTTGFFETSRTGGCVPSSTRQPVMAIQTPLMTPRTPALWNDQKPVGLDCNRGRSTSMLEGCAVRPNNQAPVLRTSKSQKATDCALSSTIPMGVGGASRPMNQTFSGKPTGGVTTTAQSRGVSAYPMPAPRLGPGAQYRVSSCGASAKNMQATKQRIAMANANENRQNQNSNNASGPSFFITAPLTSRVHTGHGAPTYAGGRNSCGGLTGILPQTAQLSREFVSRRISSTSTAATMHA